MAETEGNRALSFDWLGFAALGVAIGALQLLLDRGEQLGWFDSNEIVLMAIVSVVAFYFFVAHSLTTEHPFISIEIFRDRNFIVGLVFMFVCGVMLVASMALMAPMLQGLMGYPIIDAGVLLGTRGVGMGISMLMAGRLMTLIDPRILLFFGLIVLRRVARLLDRLHPRHGDAHDRVGQHAAGLRAGLHVRAAEHDRAVHGAGRPCARRAPPCGR